MFVTVFKLFLLPPAIQILLVLMAFLMWRWRPITAKFLLLISWLSLLVLSMPMVSVQLMNWLESPYVPTYSLMDTELEERVGAIVVLGGGRLVEQPEYEGDQLSPDAYWRVRYAAKLAQQFSLPILTSGGTVYPTEKVPESSLAATVLQEEYQIETPIWQESRSRNTWQNARFSSEILAEKNIKKVALVTHAYHMRRAIYSFNQAGIDVVPFATGFYRRDIRERSYGWLPRVEGLRLSRIALHEYLGLIFYRAK